jgi:hypothetical protein
MTWPPSPSRAKLHQVSHSFQTSPSTHASYVLGEESKKNVKSKASPSPKYVTSDEDTLSSHNYASSDDDSSLPSELVKNTNAMIQGLMKKVNNKKNCLFKREKLAKNSRSS